MWLSTLSTASMAGLWVRCGERGDEGEEEPVEGVLEVWGSEDDWLEGEQVRIDDRHPDVILGGWEVASDVRHGERVDAVSHNSGEGRFQCSHGGGVHRHSALWVRLLYYMHTRTKVTKLGVHRHSTLWVRMLYYMHTGLR